MKNIIRTFAIAAALACAAGTAARAQTPAPEARSGSGVHLGLYLNGSALQVADGGGISSGPGLGLHVGYEYTPEASVFVRVDAANIDDGNDGFRLTHADLGLRLSLGRSGSTLRPFAQAAVGARDLSDLDSRGFALTVGGGAEYFVSRAVAIEAGLSLSGGIADQGGATTAISSRFDIGVSWHP